MENFLREKKYFFFRIQMPQKSIFLFLRVKVGSYWKGPVTKKKYIFIPVFQKKPEGHRVDFEGVMSDWNFFSEWGNKQSKKIFFYFFLLIQALTKLFSLKLDFWHTFHFFPHCHCAFSSSPSSSHFTLFFIFKLRLNKTI